MKERFKFRFFDKVSKEMCYPTEYNGKAEYLERRYDLADMFRFKDFIPMQCTGLKDKNGKLIYEGDILKVVGKQTEEITGCVQWLDDFCKFSLNIANSKEGKYQSCETFCDFDYLPETEREVIGNIYENKELFEEQKWK